MDSHIINQELTPAAYIKKNTAVAHLSTEKVLVSYVQQVRSARDYAVLLACMYGYFSRLEKELDNFLTDIIPDYQLRRKAGNIYSDIGVLLQPVNTPVAMLLPVISNINEALGCFYVMEGSILGGAVIKKLLREQSPDIPQEAFSFFSGYGERNTGMWEDFVSFFNNSITTDGQLETATAAANDCFNKLEQWIKICYSGVLD